MKVPSYVGSTVDNKLFYDVGPNNPPSFIFGPKYTSQVLYQYSPLTGCSSGKYVGETSPSDQCRRGCVFGSELRISEADFCYCRKRSRFAKTDSRVDDTEKSTQSSRTNWRLRSHGYDIPTC
uniref:Uncharacterized protein n=1 Tax=Opuntia streptacantha TaxID=393608 RepID=A0A7C9E9E3_OPUST